MTEAGRNLQILFNYFLLKMEELGGNLTRYIPPSGPPPPGAYNGGKGGGDELVVPPSPPIFLELVWSDETFLGDSRRPPA